MRGGARPLETEFSSLLYYPLLRRRSVRAYDGNPIERDTLNYLESFVADHLSIAPGAARLALLAGHESSQEVFSWLFGPLFRVIKNPALTCLVIGDRSHPWHMEEGGFMGQQILLAGVQRNLGTCWVSGTMNRSRARSLGSVLPHESVLAAISFGYVPASLKLGPKHRKPFETICSRTRSELPRWVVTAVECARLSPSAANLQPWWFEAKGVTDRPFVEIHAADPRRSKPIELPVARLDRGIAMFQFLAGALHEGIDGSWSLSGNSARETARFVPTEHGVLDIKQN